MKRTLSAVLILFFASMWGCGEQDRNRPQKKTPAPKIKMIEVRPVEATPFRGSIEYVGTLTAHRKVNVATELGGSVEKLLFERGDRVKKGRLLVLISTSSFRLEIQQAQAALNVVKSQQQKIEKGSRPGEIRIAEATVKREEANRNEAERHFKRVKDLHGSNAVSNSQYDSAERALQTAHANVELAKEQLELTRKGPRAEDRQAARANVSQAQSVLSIVGDRLRKSQLHSPTDGIVAFRKVEEGEVVGPGTIITQIVDNSRMKLKLSLAEKDIPILATDKRFPFTIDAIPDEEFSAQLVFLSPTADPLTRAFPVELLVNEPDPKMADGMTARVKFSLGSQKKSIKVPTAWLREEGGHLGLLVAEKGKAVFRKTTLGAYYEQNVEILSGVSEGDRVITNPSGLKSGDAVSFKSKAIN